MGFRKDHSTTEGCFSLIKNIWDTQNEDLFSIAIYVDLAKAFNTVNHRILIRKLKELALPINFIKLLASYLENRSQHTIFNGHTSTEGLITDGVPQGSILGPALFLCYINDLSSQDLGCKLSLYADDTVLYLSGPNLADLTSRLNDSLHCLHDWCTENRLTVNANKTKAMVFKTKKTDGNDNVKIMYNTVELKLVIEYVYLGFLIDNELTLKQHAEKQYNTCNHKLFTLSKIRKYLTKDIVIKLYKTLILPILDYGDIFYNCLPNVVLDKIQRVQNRALRIADLADRYVSNVELHQKYYVQPLFIRRRINQLKMVHTYLRHHLDDNELGWGHSSLNANIRLTRQTAAPYIPLKLPKSSRYSKSCAYMAPKLWLDLPLATRQIADRDSFKSDLKTKARLELMNIQSVLL